MLCPQSLQPNWQAFRMMFNYKSKYKPWNARKEYPWFLDEVFQTKPLFSYVSNLTSYRKNLQWLKYTTPMSCNPFHSTSAPSTGQNGLYIILKSCMDEAPTKNPGRKPPAMSHYSMLHLAKSLPRWPRIFLWKKKNSSGGDLTTSTIDYA